MYGNLRAGSAPTNSSLSRSALNILIFANSLRPAIAGVLKGQCGASSPSDGSQIRTPGPTLSMLYNAGRDPCPDDTIHDRKRRRLAYRSTFPTRGEKTRSIFVPSV